MAIILRAHTRAGRGALTHAKSHQDLDILPRLKHLGFWDQRFTLAEASLTEPTPTEDAPSV